MRISDWSSDVCSSDLEQEREPLLRPGTDNIEEIARALERVGTIGAAGIARIAQIVVEIILVPAAPEHAEDVVELVALDPVLGLERRGPGMVARELCDRGEDRKNVVSGKSVSVRVDLGGRRINKKK